MEPALPYEMQCSIISQMELSLAEINNLVQVYDPSITWCVKSISTSESNKSIDAKTLTRFTSLERVLGYTVKVYTIPELISILTNTKIVEVTVDVSSLTLAGAKIINTYPACDVINRQLTFTYFTLMFSYLDGRLHCLHEQEHIMLNDVSVSEILAYYLFSLLPIVSVEMDIDRKVGVSFMKESSCLREVTLEYSEEMIDDTSLLTLLTNPNISKYELYPREDDIYNSWDKFINTLLSKLSSPLHHITSFLPLSLESISFGLSLLPNLRDLSLLASDCLAHEELLPQLDKKYNFYIINDTQNDELDAFLSKYFNEYYVVE